MVRMAGFLAGSATAIALILLVIGLPELGAPEAPLTGPVAATLPEPAIAASTGPMPEPTPEPAPEPVAEASMAALPQRPANAEPAAAPTQWHAFWSPFGSRIAADGFVRRLEALTGFDYRVVKVENGVYEVAFAYADETERDTMLSTIAAATGLELPDS